MRPGKREYVRLSTRIEKQAAEALDELAASLGVKRATLLRMILLTYLSSLQRLPEPQPTPPGLWGMRAARGPTGGMSPVFPEGGEGRGGRGG
jgi:hypothetical protein